MKTLSRKDVDIWFYIYYHFRKENKFLFGLNYETQADGIHITAFDENFEQINLCITIEDLKNGKEKKGTSTH